MTPWLLRRVRSSQNVTDYPGGRELGEAYGVGQPADGVAELLLGVAAGGAGLDDEGEQPVAQVLGGGRR